ncbi:hypothetical protein V8E51_019824 [Hyaloscypha variabilis]
MERPLEYHKVRGQSAQPILLQVCRESREEGLRSYEKVHEKCSACCPKGPSHIGCCRGERLPVYINFAVDYFHHGQDLNLTINKFCSNHNFEIKVLEKIQNLAATRGGGNMDWWRCTFPTWEDVRDLKAFLKRDSLKECFVDFAGYDSLDSMDSCLSPNTAPTFFRTRTQEEGVQDLRVELEKEIKYGKLECGVEVKATFGKKTHFSRLLNEGPRGTQRTVTSIRLTKTKKL